MSNLTSVGVVGGISAPIPYVYGAQLAWASNTTITATACQMRDSTNGVDISIGSPFAASPTTTTINGAVNGLNGLDTGSLGVSKQYAVYAISDQSGFNPAGYILSLNATNPLLPSTPSTPFPSGYSSWRRIGYVFTNSSSQFILFYQTGKGNNRYYQYDAAQAVLTGGSSATFAAVNLEAFAPLVTNSLVYLAASYVPAVAGNVASLRPTGSSAAANVSPVQITGTVAAVAQKFPAVPVMAKIATTHLNVDYIVQTSDALSLSVVGYQDSI